MINRKNILNREKERIHSGETSDRLLKKRRTSRIILFVDIIIVIIILLFIYTRTPDRLYTSTSLNFGELSYRFSITRESGNDFLFSLTIRSDSKIEKTVAYRKFIAILNIRYGDEAVYQSQIGDNISSIRLLPGELKTFVKRIDRAYFERFAGSHPEYIKGSKTLFSMSKRHIPLVADITINLKEKILTRIQFIYEVN